MLLSYLSNGAHFDEAANAWSMMWWPVLAGFAFVWQINDGGTHNYWLPIRWIRPPKIRVHDVDE